MSCKKHIANNEKSPGTNALDANSRYAERVLINYKNSLNSSRKSESNNKELDSLQYYLELLGNYCVADTFQVIDIKHVDSIDIIVSKVAGIYFDLNQLDIIVGNLMDFKGQVVSNNEHLLSIGFEFRNESGSDLTFKAYFYSGKELIYDAPGEEEKRALVSSNVWTFSSSVSYRMGFGTESTLSSSNATVKYNGGTGISVASPETNFNTYWSGTPGQYNSTVGGAATLLQQYGEHNIFQSIGWPAGAATGRRIVTTITARKRYEPNNTYTSSNSYYNQTTFFGSNAAAKSLLHWPTKVFCWNQWPDVYRNASKVYSPNKSSGSYLTGPQCNYYLGMITGDLYPSAQTAVGYTNAFISFRIDLSRPENYAGHLATQCSYFWAAGNTPDPAFFDEGKNNGCFHVGPYYEYKYSFGTRLSVPL